MERGSGYGYSKVRGLNAVLATALREDKAPIIIGQRLRKGAANTARGANTFDTEALGTLIRTKLPGPVVCPLDSADYGHPSVSAALSGGADVTVTVPMNNVVKGFITEIGERMRGRR